MEPLFVWSIYRDGQPLTVRSLLLQNFSVMSEYMTSMGRIKPRSVTGLRPVNQRKIARALRRAIGMGLMPSVHRHPEILASEMRARMEGPGGF